MPSLQDGSQQQCFAHKQQGTNLVYSLQNTLIKRVRLQNKPDLYIVGKPRRGL
jgi:hypothetical protein